MASNLRKRKETQKVKSAGGQVIHTADRTASGAVAPHQQRENNPDVREAFRKRVQESIGADMTAGVRGVLPPAQREFDRTEAVKRRQSNQDGRLYIQQHPEQNWNPYAPKQQQINTWFQKAPNPGKSLGQYGRGNIDLYNRPQYRNPDGSISTVRSISIGTDDGEVLIPTIGVDSKGIPVSWTDDEAIDHYYKTGEHLGKFRSIDDADRYAEQLHEQQEAYYSPDYNPDKRQYMGYMQWGTKDSPEFNALARLAQQAGEKRSKRYGDYMKDSAEAMGRKIDLPGFGMRYPGLAAQEYGKQHSDLDADTEYIRNKQNRNLSGASDAVRPGEEENEIFKGRGILAPNDRILQNAMLSDEQKRTYNYLYATQGAEEAEKFRNTALEEGGVNAMIAQKAFDADLRNSSYPGKIAATYIGAVEGAADSLAGVPGMARGEEQYRPRSTAEYFTSEAVRSEPEGSLARTGLELAQSAGTNTLAHLASVAGGPALGSAVFAAQAGSRAYNESLMEGHTVGEATAYGAMQALDEEITNYLLGGLSAYGGGAVQRTIGRTPVAQMVGRELQGLMQTETGRYAMRQLMDAIANNSGEAAQEYLQHFTEEFEKWVAYNHTSYDLTTPEGRAALANDLPTRQQIAASLTDPEALHEALIGFLNAGVMNAPGQITEAADIMNRGRNSDLGSMGYGAFADAIDVNPLNYSNPDTYHEARDLRNLAQEYERRNTAGMPTSTFDRGIIDRAAYEFAAHAAEDPRQMRLADTGEEYAQETEPAYAQETEPAAEAVTESVRPTSDIYGDYLARKAEYGAKKAQNDQAMSEALAGTFGKEGKKAFAEIPAERPAEAYREFAAYYNSERFGTQAPAEAQTLTPEQVTAAMKAGALDANAAYPADTMKATARSVQRIQVDGVNAGVADRSGINYDALTPQQKLRVDFTDAYITKGLGMDVRYIQSDALNGNYEGINGSFSVMNGRPTITLDVNAGMNKESDWTGDVTDMQTMLPVISHEITHFLEKSAPEAYKAISDAVIKSLANNRGYTGGYTINQIVRAEMNRMDRTEKGADGKPIKHTEADALHEIVARACEDMLSGDTKAVQAFETLDTQTKATLWDHIKSVFDNIREFFQQMLSSYKSDSAEAKAIRQNMDEFEKIRSMWQEALNGGTTTVSASEANTTQVETAKEAFSVRQFANSLDFDVRLTGEGQAYEIIDPKTGKAVKHVTPKMMEQTPMGVLVQAALDAGTINKKTANRQLKMFSDLMNLTLKYDPGSTSMVWEIAGTYLFSSVKTNSDKQYSTTIDYGTICAKTQALIDVLSKTMVQKGRGLTREEVLTAYNKTAGVGLSVPCPVCYVFSRWMGVPSLLETMRKCQDRFGNASEKEVQDYIKSMLDEYKTAKGVNEAKTKVQNRLATLERRLQEALENGDSKVQEDVRKEVSELEKKMSDLESFNWVTQVRCVGDKNGNYKLDKGYRPVPNEILLDLTKSGDFAKQFPKAWKYRTTRGAGMGKAIVPYSGATLGDFIKGTKDRWASTKNPFFNKNPKAARAAITRAATRARAQNLIGGQRFQSTSDFRAEWGIDYLMTFLECQAAGSQVQLYTKVIEAVDMFASAGAEVNLSIMPKGDGYENGKLVFSDITGVNFENALEKTRQYDNVQMILVGINDDHIRMAMADDRITFIIPWHSSGNSKDTLASLMKSVGETLNSANDYSETQNDKIIDNSAEAKAARQLRKDIIQGKLWADYKTRKAAKLTDAQQAILDGNSYLKELYRKFYVDKSAKEYGVKLNGNQSAGIFPYEYWDTSLTIKDADQNGRRFQEYCASLGIQPRFPQFAKDPGYWKTLIDRRMYNRDGTYHEPSAIDVTNVKIEQIPQAVNSNNYKDMDKIDQATLDTIRALDDRQSDLAVADDTDSDMVEGEVQNSSRFDDDIDSWLDNLDADDLFELFEDKAANPETKRRRVDEVNKRLKKLGLEFNGTKKLGWTDERIDTYLDDGHFGSTNKDYAQAYVAYISPQEFLNLTAGASTSTVDKLERDTEWMGGVDTGRLDNGMSSPMFLHISNEKGDMASVTGHEGRHRMILLGRAGFNQVPVLLFNSANKYDKTHKDSLKLKPQDFGDGFISKSREVTLKDVIPFSSGNAAEIHEKFGGGSNAEEMYSRRGVDHDAMLAELVEKYGALPKGENAQVDVTLPEWTSDTKKTRRYARTVLESGLMTDQMSDEIKEKVIKEALSYEPMTDKDSSEYAASVIRAGGTAKAQKEWDRAKRSDSLNKDDMAVAQFLLKEYANNGDVDNVIKMVEEISAEATRMGQNIQSLGLLKKYAMQAPEVGLGYIQRTVDQMNRDNKRKMGAKYKEMKIDPALAADYLNAKTSDEIDAALGKIYKNLGEQVQMTGPEAVIDKLRTWRYLSMLGNPRTHVRNLVGNAIFVPAVRLKNVIGAEIEKSMGAERTKGLSATPEARAFAMKDALLMRDALSGKADMSIRDLIMEQRKVYKIEALNKLSKANSDALETEDWWFLRMHYQDALAKYVTANDMDVNNMDGQKLAKARNYALKEAQKATYRDANKVSAWLNQSSGAGTVVKYMMEGMLPFKKTPTNILRRGVEYSPAGLIGTLTKGTHDLNTGKITLNEYIDGIASGLSGTAIFGVGMFLASVGAILGGYVDDEDKERRKLRGDQEYAVRIGNHTYTVDWAAPGSLPLFIGVETMYGLKRDHGMTFSDITAAATRLVDPMINMSMLSGLNDTLDAISYSDDKLSAFASETFYSLLGQYVPTISGQIARTIDTTQRINYQDKNTGLSKNMLYFIEKMQNKIPMMTFSNDPYLNEFGQENVTENRFVAALQNFISPGYISKVKDDRVLDELDRLSEAQDENVLPKKMPKYLGTKEDRVDLTSEQYTTFQRTAGQLSYNIIDNMIDDKRYRQLTAEEQAEAISIAYSYAKAAGRIEIQPEYKGKLTGNNKKVYNAVQGGSQAYDVILDLVTK